MSKQWPRFLLALGLATIAFPQIAVGQPDVRDHRKDPKGDRKQPPPDVKPTQAPPEARAENVAPRKGYVWVNGHWDWKGGQWQWVAGHFERARKGKRWRPHRWEQQGGGWVRIAGDWDNAPDYPTVAPPPAKERQPRGVRKRGKVWVAGHWEWRNYDWTWIRGKWENVRPGKRFVAGRWEQKGDRWNWIDDAWNDDPGPIAAPPAPQNEPRRTRRGYVWVAGHYDWEAGEYVWTPGHWEKLRPLQKWNEGRWEQKGNKWVWVAGSWGSAPYVFDNKGWTLLGSQDVQGGRDRDVISVGKYAGRLDQVMMVVTDSDLVLEDLTFTFGNGETYSPRVRATFKEGSRSRAIDLPGDDRVISKIDVRYSNLPGTGRAHVDFYGRDTGKPRPYPTTAPPAPRAEKIGIRRGFVWAPGHYQWKNGQYAWVPGHWERARAKKRWLEGRWEQRGNQYVWVEGSWGDDAPQSSWQFDSKGWMLLGSADVQGKNDRDQIAVGRQQIAFDEVTVVVTDSDLTLEDFTITFGNNEKFTPQVRHVFKEGSRSRVIELPGNSRNIKTIDLKYSNLPGTGRAHIDVYGRNTGKTVKNPDPRPIGPSKAPPPLKRENVTAKQGYIWASGRWDWKNGQYEWIPGHWERARAKQTWADGHWELKGNTYVWVEGGWR